MICLIIRSQLSQSSISITLIAGLLPSMWFTNVGVRGKMQLMGFMVLPQYPNMYLRQSDSTRVRNTHIFLVARHIWTCLGTVHSNAFPKNSLPAWTNTKGDLLKVSSLKKKLINPFINAKFGNLNFSFQISCQLSESNSSHWSVDSESNIL